MISVLGCHRRYSLRPATKALNYRGGGTAATVFTASTGVVDPETVAITNSRSQATLPLVLARGNPRRAPLDERTRILESRAGQRRGSVRQACANLAKDGEELGWVAASGVARAHASCFPPLLFLVFSSAKQRDQPMLKARRTVSTDERMSPSARPFKIARLTGEMPRSTVFGSSALITLTVLHAPPVLARINVVGFAECSHEA